MDMTMATRRRDALTRNVSRGSSARPSNIDGTNNNNSHRPQHAASTGQWQDQDKEQWTFYRESTPPPPRDNQDQQRQSVINPPSYDDRYDRVAPPAPIPRPTVCGIRKRLFWTLVCLVVFVIAAAAVGVGVGLVVGTRESGIPASDEKPPAVTTLAPSSPVPSTVTVSALSHPTQIPIDACPTANNTKYKIPQVNKTFLHMCGVDYGHGESIDLGVVWTANIQDCIVSCAGYPNCTGCGWGILPGDTGSNHRCWLKGDLKTSRTVWSGWDFAIQLA